MPKTFADTYADYRARVERALDEFLPERKGDVLFDSMRYSLFAGGKRLRPILTLAWCDLCGGDISLALPGACAVEMTHTYSLIHDDLPCMDNDSLRRGKPTNHVVFGEYVALLAGCGLFDRALATLLDHGEAYGLSPLQVLASVRCLRAAAGIEGVLTGQALDMRNDGAQMDRQGLIEVNSRKTASMLQASCELGCIAAGADDSAVNAARAYGELLGQAFQIRDDILDRVGNAASLGKTPGKDAAEKKTTFVDLLGLTGAQNEVDRLSREADRILSECGNSVFLTELTQRLCRREN